jgi:hypothetical protein
MNGNVSHTREMLQTSEAGTVLDPSGTAAAIDACLSCEQSCTSCANACLAEQDLDAMRQCIALDDTCADICGTTARVLSRPVYADHALVRALLEACVRACTICAEECARHAHHHRHCAICAEDCFACQEACKTVLEARA